MQIKVTDQEARLVGLLAQVWNEFLQLPVEHGSDQLEFCAAVHACQDKVLARAGRRAINSNTGEGD
ncbi:hypothetical protein ACCD10_17835 [Pseudomonas sp. Pseusp122]|jgi:hypothetical protein|uniref:hypothetical protein n=1 Tax=unclassified Pseudomonas TaxID=196821 RepID=UPI0039A5ACAF